MRVIISSDRSNSGKTLVSSGIMRALRKSMRVRPFKVGPDFIDPGYHRVASGEHSVNLDLWMMGSSGVRKYLSKYMKGYDIGIIEGVMGLYDGLEERYSTYELAVETGTPIVLVIDCSHMSSTVGAIVHGLREFRKAPVKGVILNRVASERHYRECAISLPEGVSALGYIPLKKDLEVSSRHLGLITVEDNSRAEITIEAMAEEVIKHVDLEELQRIASEAGSLGEAEDLSGPERVKGKAAIAYDSAFSFYYKQNIDLISKKFNLTFFSPLRDEVVEDADLIYLGGGYPELHLKQLESAVRTKGWIRKSLDRGRAIFGECGGLMYLSKSIMDDEREYDMVGIFDLRIKAKSKLTIGYTELEFLEENLLGNAGGSIRGQEFHVSEALEVNERLIMRNRRGKGIRNGMDGVKVGNALATYSHFILPTEFPRIEK